MTDLEKIKKCIKKYPKYQVFNNNDFIRTKENDLIFKDKNKTSIGFKCNPGKTIFETVCDIFEIKNIELFKSKFDEAVSGDGHELNNMLTIWSSSLCALLCYYNVSNCPLKLTINGKEYLFNEVHFELKNRVLSRPSNIDVVLVDKTNKAILFIESKFAEYLKYDKNTISDAYFRYFKNINKELFSKITNPKDKTIYHYGIKQLLTHYIGLYHFTNDKQYNYHKNDKRANLFKYYKDTKDVKVFLQEVVFNNDNDKKEEYFTNLNKLILTLNCNGKVKVLPPTTYQELFSSYNGFNSAIGKFYKLN